MGSEFAIFVPSSYPEGNAVSRATHMMAKGLASQGVAVTVLARWSSSAASPPEPGITVRTFGSFDQGKKRGSGRRAWLMSAAKFCICLAWSTLFGKYKGAIYYGLSPLFLPAAILAGCSGKQFAFVQYDLYRPSSSDSVLKRYLGGFYAWCEKLLSERSRLLVLSESSLLVNKFAELAPGVAVFPNWPPTDTAYFACGDRARGREVCDVGASTPLIVYTGVITRLEGVDLLLEAMSTVASQNPDAVLAIAGMVCGDSFPGPVPDYHGLPQRLGIERNVRFLGVVDRETVRDLLAAADCLVMPKRDHEGNAAASPIKLGEYLASGRPVVASRVCGIDGWLEHDRDVFLCEPGNVSDLSAALLRVLADRKLGTEIGERGREAGGKHCDYVSWGNAFLKAWADAGACQQ